jgi:hypothetical protein
MLEAKIQLYYLDAMRLSLIIRMCLRMSVINYLMHEVSFYKLVLCISLVDSTVVLFQILSLYTLAMNHVFWDVTPSGMINNY